LRTCPAWPALQQFITCPGVHLNRSFLEVPFSADAAANFFLSAAKNASRGLTNMQVQKLVFYAQGWHLALDSAGRPLISEQFEAWKYGPVVRSLYREFKPFGSGPITEFAREANFYQEDGKWQVSVYMPSVEDSSPADLDCDFARALLKKTWQLYGGYSAIQLSNMTHAENEPWRVIRDAMGDPLPMGIHIPNETIRECFRAKLNPDSTQH
jgi:uncharacterized phage-associated protein